MEPLLVREPEARAALGISRTKFYELLAAGSIESITIGRARLIPVAALRKFVDERRASPEGTLGPERAHVTPV